MGWYGDMLMEAEYVQDIRKPFCVRIPTILNMYVKIPGQNQFTRGEHTFLQQIAKFPQEGRCGYWMIGGIWRSVNYDQQHKNVPHVDLPHRVLERGLLRTMEPNL